MLHRLAHGLACPHVQVCSLISGAIAICLHMRSVCPESCFQRQMAEAGSSIPLSVLLEYQGCRRRLSVSTVDGIPDAISDCLEDPTR